jgi:hypothetical protein
MVSHVREAAGFAAILIREKKMRLGSVFAVVLVMSFFTAALPAAGRDIDDCNQKFDPDLSIAGCTRVLDRGGGTRQNRSILLTTRGDAWTTKENYVLALADFNEAIRLDPRTPIRSMAGREFGRKPENLTRLSPIMIWLFASNQRPSFTIIADTPCVARAISIGPCATTTRPSVLIQG